MNLAGIFIRLTIKQRRSRDIFHLLISFLAITNLSDLATKKLRTEKETFSHGSDLVVINHSYPV